MTGFVLRKLPPARTEYVFTDVTQMFGSHANRSSTNILFVRYQVLDIESDRLHRDSRRIRSTTRSRRRTARDKRSGAYAGKRQASCPEGLLILLEGAGFHVGHCWFSVC